MQILLDTTVQIERMFFKSKRKMIDRILKENDCYTSSYSLGEFNSNIVRDFVTLYNIMQMENNINDVVDKINEKVFNRNHKRVIYILNDICRLYDNKFDLVKEEIELYGKRLRARFMYLLNKQIINETSCNRANAIIRYSDGVAKLENYKCTKKDKFCRICEFWKEHVDELNVMNETEDVPEKFCEVLRKIRLNEKEAKGDNCRTVGDCIIVLETTKLNDHNVCTSNIKDFQPICDLLNVNIIDII